MIKAMLTGAIGNPLFLIIAAIVIFAAGAGSGWTANGWRLGAELANEKTDRANEVAKQSQDALKDLEQGVKRVADAAAGAQDDLQLFGASLATLNKEFNYAKRKPLPAGCHPDDDRVRQLTGTAAETDKAIARQRPGG
jgi:hypothetical protein